MLAPGTPLQLDQSFPVVISGTVDARKAASTVLMAYLGCAGFLRGGGDVNDTPFRLSAVVPEWPDPSVEMVFPSASVLEKAAIPYGAHSFTPTCLEETWNQFKRDTVLWKTDELAIDFQVDFWCNDDATREAIAARLPALFSPSEDRRGVMLSGMPEYFDRTVRAVLIDHQRIDVQEAAFQNERRLMTTIRCDIDDVHLRCAVELRPRISVEMREASDVAVLPEIVTPTAG